MLTESQLEIAARELCRLRGHDPDQKVCHGADPYPDTGYVPAVALFSPLWRLTAKEIRGYEMIAHSIKLAENAGDTLDAQAANVAE